MRNKEIEVPTFDRELFKLLYQRRGGDISPPGDESFKEEILARNVLVHANSDLRWFMGRINYPRGLTLVVSRNGEFGYGRITLYQDKQSLGSIETHEDRNHKLLLITPENFSLEVATNMKNYLGGLQLLADRDELMLELYPHSSMETQLRRISDGWRLPDARNRGVDLDVTQLIEGGLARQTRIAYSLLAGLHQDYGTTHGKISHLPLFDEDPRESHQNWNHQLFTINYSKDLAQKIKKRLRERKPDPYLDVPITWDFYKKQGEKV